MTRYCNFCGASDATRYLVTSAEANICEGCVDLCWQIVECERAKQPHVTTEPTLKLPPSLKAEDAPWRPYPGPRSNDNRDGFVYFLHAKVSNRIKIGWSANPGKRIADLQSSCPELLECLAAIPGRIADEHAIHERFVGAHAHREWFHGTPELLAYIKEVCSAPAS